MASASRNQHARLPRPLLALLLAGGLLAAAQAAEAPLATFDFTVSAGDTLIGLSQRYLEQPTDWPKLQRLNKIANPKRLRPGSMVRIPVAWMREEKASAEVLSVAGAASGADGAKLAVGARLAPGAVVRTEADGFVNLRAPDGSLIAVQPRSEARLGNLSRYANTDIFSTLLRMVTGRVEAVVNKLNGASRFEVQTDLAVAGVRGTKFRVAADRGGASGKPSAQTEVLEGTVGFAAVGAGGPANPSAQAVVVAAGYGSITDENGKPRAASALLPAPQIEAAAALQERLVARFRFPPVAGAGRYQAQVANDRDFRMGIGDAAFTTPEIKFADLPDGEYFLRARAVDGLGLEGIDAVFAFRVKARPEPPLTTLPAADGKLRATTAAFNWAANPQAASYRIQIAEDEAFTRVVQDQSVVEVDFTSAALPFGEYHWRVRSVGGSGPAADAGPWGDSRKFILRPPPKSPEPPEETSNGIAFNWSGEPGQRFLLQVARDALFTQLVEARELTEPKATIARPPQGTYYLRIRATDADGFVGPFTAPQRFVVINRVIDSGGANLTTGNGDPVRLQ